VDTNDRTKMKPAPARLQLIIFFPFMWRLFHNEILSTNVNALLIQVNTYAQGLQACYTLQFFQFQVFKIIQQNFLFL